MKKILGIASGIFALIGVALFFILPGWYVGGAIFFGLAIIIAIIKGVRKKFETKCSKCKKPYDYENDVAWRLIRSGTKGANSANNTLASTYFVYDITCQCSDCGTQKRYRKKIQGPSINDKGQLDAVDPEFVLEDNFDQSQDFSWGAIFVCILMGLAFIAGGLFFSGSLAGIFEDIDIPGITQTEMGEDPADYYGTYYGISEGELVTITIDAEKCTIVSDNGMKTETDVYEYDYASAEYIEAYWQGVKVSPSLLLYTSSDKSRAKVFSVEKTANGYELTSAAGLLVKTDVLTFSDVTNDPKDYYGTYRLDSLYITLNEDGTAKMELGDGENSYPYFYADSGYVSKWFGKTYNAAIIVNAGEGNAYVLKYENGALTLSDQYTFTK